MLSSVESHTSSSITTLFAFLHAQGQGDYLGERITQLEHSLQCAHLAQSSPSHSNDKEVILAALLHDVGRFIPAADKMAIMVDSNGKYIGRASHEVLGERYLRELGFSEKVCSLVGAHVMAKRYLVATDKEYYDGLSETSKRTLGYQGGGFTAEQVKEAQADPLLEAKLAVRRWDDLAKVPGITVPPLEHYQDIAYKCLLESRKSFTLHSRTYHLPSTPTVVVCVDGFDPEYLTSSLPTLQSFVSNGFHAPAKSCMPSFTNPNNVSIITGTPPSTHGIAGNFFLDRETGKETMIVDDTLLRGSTLLEQMSERGVRIAAITAKDKLRRIIGHGLQFKNEGGAVCFSAEKAAECTMTENGIENVETWLGRNAPSQYSADLSLFVLDAGIKLLQEGRADFLYLTLSDYVQHKHAPGSKEADEFMGAIDDRLKALAGLAVVGVTGDHGMSSKSTERGEPNVLFLEDVLSEKFGEGAVRVICPITDPFVRHHGALGGFVRVYLTDIEKKEEVLNVCKELEGVEMALDRETAAKELEMPLDREADVVVIASADHVIGSSRDKHDLSKVRDHPLRSHGGLSEQDVPVLVSRPVRDADVARTRSWRNYDIFDLVLNWSV